MQYLGSKKHHDTTYRSCVTPSLYPVKGAWITLRTRNPVPVHGLELQAAEHCYALLQGLLLLLLACLMACHQTLPLTWPSIVLPAATVDRFG